MDLAILIIATWVLSTCFHEFGHAIVAYWGGDKSVKDKGYLTLNPMVYFNSATTLVIPVLALMLGGIPLPGAAVAINHTKIKNRLVLSLVSFAGPLFTMLFTIALIIFNVLVLPSLKSSINDAHIYAVLQTATNTLIYLEIYVFYLNLLPLPPLDGFGILEPWLPRIVVQKAREYANICFLLLMGLFFYVDAFSFTMSFVAQLSAAIVGVDIENAIEGIKVIRANQYPLIGVLVVAWILKSKMAPPQEKADQLMKEKKYNEALLLYDQALAKKEDPRLLIAKSTCLLSIGRKEEALVSAEKAIKLEPDSPQSLGIAAACYAEIGENEKALDAADRAIKSDTTKAYPFTIFVKGSVLNNMEKYSEALESIDDYLKLEPKSIEGLFVRGSCLEMVDRFEEALATYDKAARTGPDSNIRASLAKGLLLCALSRSNEGIAEFEKFLPKEAPKRVIELNNLKELLSETAKKLDSQGRADMARSAREAISQLN